MATKKTAPTTKKTNDQSVVTRITASDTSKKITPKNTVVANTPTHGNVSALGHLATPFIASGRYFKGAWYELKQVRWPNRKATWGLTAAVIGFTAGFTIIILLLDALFKYLFQLMLG